MNPVQHPFHSRDYNPTQPGWEPDNFQAIEVHGVRNIGPLDDGTTCYEIDDHCPQSYSVYLYYKPEPQRGGLDCVGDFSLYGDAVDYAIELSEKFGWPVHLECDPPLGHIRRQQLDPDLE